MKERIILASTITVIILSGLLLSGILTVPGASAAPDLPPHLLSTPALAPSYSISCDFSNPDPAVWTEIAHVDPTECTYWPDQGQTSCGQNCDYEVITVTSGLSYTMKTCAPDCTCKASCSECCSDDTTGWTVYAETVEDPVTLWAASAPPEEDGCGSGGFPTPRVTDPICQQCNSSSFTVPGDGEPVAIILERKKIPGFWYHQPHVGYSLFVMTTTQVGLYYPLVYSDTLDITQGYNPGVHNGIDFSVTEGRPVFSVYAGTVTASGYDDTMGYYVTVDHGYIGADTYESHYYHLSAINAQVGETLTQSCQIAWSGNTGLSTGPHLHLGIKKNGSWTDPAPLLQFYPGACRSSCGGLTNPEFFSGVSGWSTSGASWAASAYPNEGIVNLLAGGYLRQALLLSSGEYLAAVRIRAYSDGWWHIRYGDWYSSLQVVGDGNWHVIGVPITGDGLSQVLEVGNDFDSPVVVIDWICIGEQGQGVTPPTPGSCNLDNYDFSAGGTDWASSGATFAAGVAHLTSTGYIAQSTTVPENVAMVQVVARSQTGTSIQVSLDGVGTNHTISSGGIWQLYNWAPVSALSGTLPLTITNSGANPVEIDYVCILTEGESPPPPVDPWAACEQYWPGGDWLNIGKWVLWLWCMLEVWLRQIWLAILGVPDKIIQTLNNFFNYLDYLSPTMNTLEGIINNALNYVSWGYYSLAGVPDWLVSWLLYAINNFLNSVDGNLGTLIAKGVQLLNNALNYLDWAYDSLGGVPQWIIDWINRAINSVANSLNEFFNNLWPWINQAINAFLNALLSGSLFQFPFDLVGILNAFLNWTSEIFARFWQMVNRFLNLISSVADLTEIVVNGLANSLSAESADLGLPTMPECEELEGEDILTALFLGFCVYMEVVDNSPLVMVNLLIMGVLGFRLALWTIKKVSVLLGKI